MVYTEIKERNGRKYYYRVISIREDEKITKKRIYLGINLAQKKLKEKEADADKSLLSQKINKNIQKIRSNIIKVLKKYRVEKAGIFGSYARGEQNGKSDVDIIITYPKSPKGRGFGFVRIEYELEEALKKKVDLITYNEANPLIKKRILKEEIRII